MDRFNIPEMNVMNDPVKDSINSVCFFLEKSKLEQIILDYMRLLSKKYSESRTEERKKTYSEKLRNITKTTNKNIITVNFYNFGEHIADFLYILNAGSSHLSYSKKFNAIKDLFDENDKRIMIFMAEFSKYLGLPICIYYFYNEKSNIITFNNGNIEKGGSIPMKGILITNYNNAWKPLLVKEQSFGRKSKRIY